jgi:hypothetical protein
MGGGSYEAAFWDCWRDGVVSPIQLPRHGTDTLTLASGEVVEGTITSEKDAEVQVEITNESRTLSSTRIIHKAEIKSVTRNSPEQKIHQNMFSALDRCKLYPSQEFTVDQYNQDIEAFQKFLSDHLDDSIRSQEFRGRIAAWKAEASNLQSGKVKFANQWMIPEEKKLRSLQQQLAELLAKRNSLAVSIAKSEGELRGLQTRLATLPLEVTVQEHVWENVPAGWDRHGTTYKVVDWVYPKQVPNPKVGSVNDRITSCHRAIASGGEQLPILDASIQSIQAQLPEAQRAYEGALAKSKTAPAPPTASQTPAPFVAQPLASLIHEQRKP